MPRNTAQNIAKKIRELAVNPRRMRNVKKLTDHPGYRLRIGDWRVVYTLNENGKRNPTIETLKAIASALEIEPEMLI